MQVVSINDTLQHVDGCLRVVPTAIRVEGSFVILSYGLTEIIYNDSGRAVFRVTLDPVIPKVVAPLTLTFRQRLSAAWNILFNRI